MSLQNVRRGWTSLSLGVQALLYMIFSLTGMLLIAAVYFVFCRPSRRRRSYRPAATSDQNPQVAGEYVTARIDGFERLGSWWSKQRNKLMEHVLGGGNADEKRSFWKSLARKEKDAETERAQTDQIYELAETRSVEERARPPSISERYA